jgi:hypothetical protein
LKLDANVDAALRQEARRTDKPLKRIVNDALQFGLPAQLG